MGGPKGEGDRGFERPRPGEAEIHQLLMEIKKLGGSRQNQNMIREWRKLYILTVCLKRVYMNVTFCLVSEDTGSRPVMEASLGGTFKTRVLFGQQG